MEGARVGAAAPVEGGIAALNAGCDLVLLCNQSKSTAARPVDALLDGLQDALEQRPLAGRCRQRGAPPGAAAADARRCRGTS